MISIFFLVLLLYLLHRRSAIPLRTASEGRVRFVQAVAERPALSRTMADRLSSGGSELYSTGWGPRMSERNSHATWAPRKSERNSYSTPVAPRYAATPNVYRGQANSSVKRKRELGFLDILLYKMFGCFSPVDDSLPAPNPNAMGVAELERKRSSLAQYDDPERKRAAEARFEDRKQ